MTTLLRSLAEEHSHLDAGFHPSFTGEPCPACGHQPGLFILSLPHSIASLYDDAAFPGRCIVSMKEHYDTFNSIPRPAAAAFLSESRAMMRVMKKVTGAASVNFTISGDDDSHVHAHIVPRFAAEEDVTTPPWGVPVYVQRALPAETRDVLLVRYRSGLMSELPVLTTQPFLQ